MMRSDGAASPQAEAAASTQARCSAMAAVAPGLGLSPMGPRLGPMGPQVAAAAPGLDPMGPQATTAPCLDPMVPQAVVYRYLVMCFYFVLWSFIFKERKKGN